MVNSSIVRPKLSRLPKAGASTCSLTSSGTSAPAVRFGNSTLTLAHRKSCRRPIHPTRLYPGSITVGIQWKVLIQTAWYNARNAKAWIGSRQAGAIQQSQLSSRRACHRSASHAAAKCFSKWVRSSWAQKAALGQDWWAKLTGSPWLGQQEIPSFWLTKNHWYQHRSYLSKPNYETIGMVGSRVLRMGWLNAEWPDVWCHKFKPCPMVPSSANPRCPIFCGITDCSKSSNPKSRITPGILLGDHS